MPRLSHLRLQVAKRPSEDLGDGTYRTGRTFLDFVVDGGSLLETTSAKKLDLISCITPAWTEISKAAISRLLLESPADHPDNRRSLYICPECGDLGCGAVTAVIESHGDEIVWRDFGHENNYEENIDRAGVEHLGPYHFSKEEYVETLKGAFGFLDAEK